MWVSSSILNLKSSSGWKNHWFTRTKAFGYFFSLASLADKNPIFQSDSGKPSYSGSRYYVSSSSKHFGVPSDCVETIRNVLMKHSWIQRYECGFSTELDQYKVIRILDDFFQETLDASIALYFFRWSELWIGSESTRASLLVE
ncbi:Pentatricopeptide repeat-containing protein [Cardamine amara subsp. amara]|uniref:Pentatricopeptide repeat-containing protein n=1 Tax=Cardamine amara subsp. amara TaxID=228776 RepID=A0ABD1BME1_CARAN